MNTPPPKPEKPAIQLVEESPLTRIAMALLIAASIVAMIEWVALPLIVCR